MSLRAPDVVDSLPLLFAAADPGQELIDIMGHSAKPNLMWRCDVASGATELVVGTDHLSDVSSPSKQVADTPLGIDTTGFTFNSAESMDAASSSVADVGDESMALLVWLRFTAGNAGNFGIVGKRLATGDNTGYILQTNSDNKLNFATDHGAAIKSVVIAVDHGTTNPQTVLCLSDRNADLTGVYSREGSGTTNTTTGTLSSAEIFTIAQSTLRNAAAMNVAGGALWWGIGAEGITGAMRTLVAQRFEFEA